MDDDVFNEDKIFEVMLSEPTAGAALGKSKCTIVTILNDDGKVVNVQVEIQAFYRSDRKYYDFSKYV